MYVFSLHTGFFDNFFLFITQVGNSFTVALLTIALLGWFFYKKNFNQFKLLMFIVGGSAVAGKVIKTIIARPRPELAIYILDSFSFPSGHATSAMALYGVFIYLIFYSSLQTGYKYLTIILCFLMIVSIGFSRIYLGFHYLSDVLAGYVLGFIFLVATIWLLKKRS